LRPSAGQLPAGTWRTADSARRTCSANTTPSTTRPTYAGVALSQWRCGRGRRWHGRAAQSVPTRSGSRRAAASACHHRAVVTTPRRLRREPRKYRSQPHSRRGSIAQYVGRVSVSRTRPGRRVSKWWQLAKSGPPARRLVVQSAGGGRLPFRHGALRSTRPGRRLVNALASNTADSPPQDHQVEASDQLST
jgi:hypothetical protein